MSSSCLLPSAQPCSSPPDYDDYYQDRGLSPEDEPTKERVSAAEPQITPTVDIAGVNVKGETANQVLVNQKALRIFECRAGGRRAKIPDEEDQLNGVVHSLGEAETAPNPSTLEPTSRWGTCTETSGSISTNSIEKASWRHVMLHLGKEEDEGAQKLVLRARVPTGSDKSRSQNNIAWQHSAVDDMTFENLECLVSKAKYQGLQEREIRLTRRLLRRVRKEAEREFVGGSFLSPLALRYDMLDNSKFSGGESCLFLAFPYFSLDKAQPRKPSTKGSPEHPVRTLLQSSYRLNDTSERDQFQSVRLLGSETLTLCIDPSNRDLTRVSRKVKEELISVPQLWVLVLGLDKMITTGPIGNSALLGNSIKVKDQEPSTESKRCSLIRISFRNQRRWENLTYPVEQCASWFGLLNKHQQICSILKKDKANADPKAYKMEVQGQVLESKTWASVQHAAHDEVLNIRIRGPLKSRKVWCSKAESGSESVSQQAENTDDESDPDPGSSVNAPAGVEKLEDIPVTSAFLEWSILDEFRHPDRCPLDEKLNRFLNDIYRSLPAATAGGATGLLDAGRRFWVAGKTRSEVQSHIHGIQPSSSGTNAPTALELFNACERLFHYFLPRKHDEQSAPIQLFWGAIHEIMAHSRYLQDFLDQINALNGWAERIHRGVHFKRTIRTSDGKETQEDAISESAILLSSMVDAIGAIFRMLIEAVRDVRRETTPSRCGARVSSYGNKARKLLETARDELISEAGGAPVFEGIGPVLTPEAISIKLLERLVCGVFRSGNVDVIRIYEECVEQLALKVRDRFSRRLLQDINAFEEEIGIIIDVLDQQRQVLVDFQQYLNPSSYTRPSAARMMRFNYETKGINRILAKNAEQLKSCAELKERAKALAVKNVQLVDTLQDDNNRVVYIFTFITILFVPATFIAGIFGMNLVGISDTTSTSLHFWEIALPMTAGIMLASAAVIKWGERIRFELARAPCACIDKLREKLKKKRAVA